MRNWFKFIFQNKRLLGFGFTINFFSSLGQTFFVSIFTPFWIANSQISNALFGSLYSVCTIIAAFLLSFSGKYIDSISLKKFSIFVLFGIIISTLILSQATSLIVLGVGLLLARWFGQGLMPHTSATTIAKFFKENRGQALSVSSMGHPAGQFVFPFIILGLISLFDWQISLIIISIISFVIVFFSIKSLSPILEKAKFSKQENIVLNNKSYFKSFIFWVLALNIFVLPFVCTAIFLYQFTIGANMGYSMSWITFSFSLYPIFNASTLLFSGFLIDKFSAKTLFPLYLLPTILGLFILAFTNSQYAFPIFYALLGISMGVGSPLKTAIQIEIYGTENLGRIRSYLSTILVVGTALGPPIFGYFIDNNFSVTFFMTVAASIVVLVMLLSFKVWRL